MNSQSIPGFSIARMLGDYLDYAKHGVLVATDDWKHKPDSDLEASVANVPAAHGYEAPPNCVWQTSSWASLLAILITQENSSRALKVMGLPVTARISVGNTNEIQSIIPHPRDAQRHADQPRIRSKKGANIRALFSFFRLGRVYTLYVLDAVVPPLPVQLVWENWPRG